MIKAKLIHANIMVGSTELADALESFYRDRLGMVVKHRNVVPGKADRRFLANEEDPDGVVIEVIGDLTEETPTPYSTGGALEFLAEHGPGLDHLCFEVENVDEACRELEAAGVKIELQPYDFQGFARLAWLKDPAGVNLELVEYLK